MIANQRIGREAYGTSNLDDPLRPKPRLRKMNLDRNAKLERLTAAIERQRRFLGSVPDPDNRERAEANLMTLIFLRDELEQEQEHDVAEVVVK